MTSQVGWKQVRTSKVVMETSRPDGGWKGPQRKGFGIVKQIWRLTRIYSPKQWRLCQFNNLPVMSSVLKSRSESMLGSRR
jgi:hypothetical protein